MRSCCESGETLSAIAVDKRTLLFAARAVEEAHLRGVRGTKCEARSLYQRSDARAFSTERKNFKMSTFRWQRGGGVGFGRMIERL